MGRRKQRQYPISAKDIERSWAAALKEADLAAAFAARSDPATLLGQVAAALTACERMGLPVKLRHGVVITDGGYVLPADGEWVARTRVYTPFTPPSDLDDD